MALQGPTLVARDGYVFIMKEYAASEPGEVRAHYWPVGLKSADFSRNYLSGTFPANGFPARDVGGHYEVNVGGMHPLRVRLEHGGQTQAKHIDKRIVHPPKVRSTVELKWDDIYGYWLKSSKSTKWQWVPAGEGKAPRARTKSQRRTTQKPTGTATLRRHMKRDA